MKTKKLLILLVFSLIFSASSALAWETSWPDSPAGTALTKESTLPNLIQYLYEWAIALGGLAVFVSLLISGVQYLTSMGDPISMKNSMSRIQSAFMGLLLLLGSWMILNTINPDLTSFESSPLDQVGIPNVDTTDFKSIDTNVEDCDRIEIQHTAGTIILDNQGHCEKNLYIAAGNFISSQGIIESSEGGSDVACQGSIQFFTSKDCGEGLKATYPANAEDITIDETIRSIKFF